MTARKTLDQMTSDDLDELHDRLADYENRITWHTTCGSCARILDSSIRETERAERAEAAIARIRALHQPQPDGSGFPDSNHCTTCSTNGGDGYQYLVPWPCPTIAALTPQETP